MTHYTSLLLEEIAGRGCQFQPYGVALTKKQGRADGINPVWYVDITPSGHPWLAKNIDNLLDKFLVDGEFENPDLERITPFIEQMGSKSEDGDGRAYRKEFWWEREWRFVGDYSLPDRYIGLCPENEIPEFESICSARFIDPRWSLERMIAHLAGYDADDVEVL